jgi:ubiquitin C-terminal hydrolase
MNTKFQEYENKGLSGLSNLGNTCFLNSCMQVLSHTYELNSFLNLGKYKEKLNKNKCDSVLLLEWDKLRQILWKENCIVSPFKFVRAVQEIARVKNQELFTGFSQNDLPEFLIFVVDCFHTALSREVAMTIQGRVQNEKDKMAMACYETIKQMYSKDYSEIWNLFYGTQISLITSLETNSTISMTPEPYFILNLPIPQDNKSPTLLDCFDLYVEAEIMDGENKVLNEKTGNREAVKKYLTFWSFPTILVIDIKRFNYNNRKNQILVDFPLNSLNLSKYVSGYGRDSYIYDLYAVCNHSGNVFGGHYTCFVKNANGKWYHFNDTNVAEVVHETQIVTPKAYCFFYRKRT